MGVLSPLGQAYKQFMPLPTIAGAAYGANNFATSEKSVNDDSQYQVRVDQTLPRGGRLFAMYFRDKDNSISYGITPVAGIYNPLRGQTGSVEWDQPLQSNWLNTLRVGIFRSVTDYGGVPASVNVGAILGLKNVNGTPAYWGLPAMGITGISTPTTLNFNLHRLTTRGGIHDNVSFVHGRHVVDFGFAVEPTQYPQDNGAVPRGLINYTGAFSAPSPSAPATEGSGLADFLLGSFVNGEANPTGFDPFLSSPYWAWYAQDKIKVNRKLTVTLGVRWDYWEPPVERYNRWVAFDQNTGQLVFVLKDPFTYQTDHTTLSGVVPRGMFENWHKTNYSPRIGIAYLASRNTTVRAGFGTYYSQGMMNFQIFSSFGNGGPPFANVTQVSNDITQLTPTELDSQLFPAPSVGTITPGSTITSPDIHAPQSYVEQATFSVERQIGTTMLASVSYNGSFGHHVMGDYNANQASLLNPANPLPLDERRPYPMLGDILLQGNYDNSTYNALGAHFEKRMSGGVSFIASYTWSKAMDLFSSNGGGIENQDAHCRKCDYAPADFNMPNYFALGYVWQLPFGNNRQYLNEGTAAKILGGWQWSGITQFHSGTPLDPLNAYAANVDPVAGYAERPNRVCNGNLSNRSLTEWFDTSCYPANLPNTFGNSGRNTIISPGAQLWDMSMSRIFKIREKVDFTVRGEFFSIFNHQNWGAPDTSVTDPQFGEIFSKFNPRVIELMMALRF